MPLDPEDNRELIRRYFDLLNASDLSGIEEILSPDVVFFGPRAPEGVRGPEAFIEFITALRRDSPDIRFAERETVVEGDRVASLFTMTRTHRTGEATARKSSPRAWTCSTSRTDGSTGSMLTSTGSGCSWRWESSSRRRERESLSTAAGTRAQEQPVREPYEGLLTSVRTLAFGEPTRAGEASAEAHTVVSKKRLKASASFTPSKSRVT